MCGLCAALLNELRQTKPWLFIIHGNKNWPKYFIEHFICYTKCTVPTTTNSKHTKIWMFGFCLFYKYYYCYRYYHRVIFVHWMNYVWHTVVHVCLYFRMQEKTNFPFFNFSFPIYSWKFDWITNQWYFRIDFKSNQLFTIA